MTTILQDIRGALQAPLEGVSGFPAAANRAYQGIIYKPVIGTPWARITLLNNSRRPFALSDTKIAGGLLMVSVFQPAKDSPGTATLEALADRIAVVYDPGVPLDKGAARVLINYSEPKEGPEEADWLQYIVTVSWRCFTS